MFSNAFKDAECPLHSGLDDLFGVSSRKVEGGGCMLNTVDPVKSLVDSARLVTRVNLGSGINSMFKKTHSSYIFDNLI